MYTMNRQGMNADSTAALEQELFELRRLTTKEVEESWAEVTRLHDICASKDALIRQLQEEVKTQHETIVLYESNNVTNGSGVPLDQAQETSDIQDVSPQASNNDLSLCDLAVVTSTASAVTSSTTGGDQGSTGSESRHRRLSFKSLADSLHTSYSRMCFQDGGSDHQRQENTTSRSNTTAADAKKQREQEELERVKRIEREEELEIKLQQRESAIENLEQALMNQTRLVQKLREELDSQKALNKNKKIGGAPDKKQTLMRSQSVRQSKRRVSLIMDCDKDDLSKSEHKPGTVVEYPSLLISRRRRSQS